MSSDCLDLSFVNSNAYRYFSKVKCPLFLLIFHVVLLNQLPGQTDIQKRIDQLESYVDAVIIPSDSIIPIAEYLLEKALEAQDEELEKKSNFYLAVAYSHSERQDEALALLSNLEKFNLDVYWSARVDLLIGYNKHLQGNYEEALIHYTSAYESFKNINKVRNELLTLLNIGRLHMTLGEDEKAFDTYSTVIERNDEQLPKHRARVLNALGTYYTDKNELDSAQFYYQQALDWHIKLNDKRGTSHGYNNLAIVAYYKNDIKGAIEGFKAALKIRLGLDNQSNISDSYYNIGSLYADVTAYKDAIYHFRLGLDYAERANSIVAQRDLMNELASVYEKMSQYDSAFYYLQAATVFKDSILNRDKQREIVALQEKFNSDLLRTDKVIAEQESEIRTTQRNLLFLAFIAVFLAAIWIYFYQRGKYRKNIELSEKDKLLAEQEVALARKDVELKQEQISNFANQLLQKTEVLNELKKRLEEQEHQEQKAAFDYEKITADLATNLSEEKNWLRFKLQFESAYPEFFERLLKNNPDLTLNDLRLSSLIKLNLTTKEIAQILSISTDSVSKAKYRLRNKFDHKSQQALEVELQNL